MSVKESIEAKCPQCGTDSQTTAWRSINTRLDPEARELLLANNVNVFRCPKCGYESLVDIDLLYHDPDRRFCVQFYPFERVGDDRFLENFTHDNEPAVRVPEGMNLPERMSYVAHPHIVFDMGEMVRYIAFRERLDEPGPGEA